MNHPWTTIFSILFAIASVFLIFIVLLQRGRGGGLAGAFGATGGQSAFGTRAGDVFTRITIVVAVIWVALAGITGAAMSKESQGRFQSAALPESGLVPAVAPAGKPDPFEAGDQGTKSSAATKGTTPSKGTTPAAPAKSPSTVTPPPAKTPPATDATKQTAPAK
jgi:preprotein translocase subunit SecG